MTIGQYTRYLEEAQRLTPRVHVPTGSFQGRYVVRNTPVEHVLRWEGGAGGGPVYYRSVHGRLGEPRARGLPAVYAWEEASGISPSDDIGLDILLWDDTADPSQSLLRDDP